jgi:beta-galactosidase/beta-glucuronidase
VVYRWDWMSADEYFEFRIEKSPVTNQTLLTVTDFADKNDIADQKMLWDSQIHNLMHRIGS